MKFVDKNAEIFQRSSINRLHTLTDCIFAITMIALFFFIQGPADDLPATDAAVWGYLRSQTETVGTALVTFMLMGFYWVSNHNQGKFIKQTDMVQVWITMVYLMFIALLPFPSALTMKFQDTVSARIFYSLDVFFIGLLSYVRWLYASGNRRLVEADLDADTVSRISRETLVEPCGAIVSMGGAFINTYCWQFAFYLVPVAAIVVRRIWGKSKQMI
jgi:uncharacterized membrane protein